MASRSPVKRDDRSGEASVRDLFRTVALTELAIVVPILISGYVLFVAARFLGRFLTPIVGVLPEQSTLVGQALAALPIGATVLLVGLVAHFRAGARAIDYVDDAIARLPGVGTIYRSFRRMSDVEGIRATVTSGVAFEADDEEGLEGARWELSDFDRVPDLERLRALGIDTDALRSMDREDLREFGAREIEERLLVTDDRDDESDETEETAGSETAADEDSETAANADGDPGA